ncbi:MAG: hypothetical protein HYU36_07280 [Planctomycetes bacterium]|nr:hypothetical protein [Planctomycetota bacterium]
MVTLSPEAAPALYDELAGAARDERTAELNSRLEKLAVPDLKVLAKETGLRVDSDLSRQVLIKGIMGRIRESVLLSTNTNVTSPRTTMPASRSSRNTENAVSPPDREVDPVGGGETG